MYPVFLSLEGRPVLLVGAGVVASAKLDGLQREGALVTVVAPAISDAIRRAGVTLRQREFEEHDLDGMWWVVAAAPPEVNRRVKMAAESRRIFVNAVDDPANASAFLGGVVRRSGVTVAISTEGRAPALAGLLREAIDAYLPIELDTWMAVADEARRTWKRDGVPMEERRPLLLQALNRLYLERQHSQGDERQHTQVEQRRPNESMIGRGEFGEGAKP